MHGHWIPQFLPDDPWFLACLVAGAATLAVGSATWLAGCTRIAARRDWGSAGALAAAGGALVGVTLVGRPALALMISPGWVMYHLAFIGRVSHADFRWIVDDGVVWMFVGAGLAMAGAALLTVPGVPRRAP